jgi:hypothetical protein
LKPVQCAAQLPSKNPRGIPQNPAAKFPGGHTACFRRTMPSVPGLVCRSGGPGMQTPQPCLPSAHAAPR